MIDKQKQKLNMKVQWAKFAVVLALYLLFLVWVESWLGLIVVPFIFDVYITKKIHWQWWKDEEGPVRFIMSWVDALVFALVAVYFINLFFFQNYVIPSSSLEKSLLTGDYLFVSKVSYGPRIPETPLTMPLTQHTMPLVNVKSYIEWPHWDYRRVKGLGNVKLNDIVVFNYPAGDTLVNEERYQANDYYQMVYSIGDQLMQQNGQERDVRAMNPLQQRHYFEQVYATGRNYISSMPGEYGDIISRPTDRRENYVKRCVGLPGQTLQIKNRIVYLNGKANKEPDNVQYTYKMKLKGEFPIDLADELGITNEDLLMYNQSGVIPLTKKAYMALKANRKLVESISINTDATYGDLYPLNIYTGWTRDNYGPVWIPKKGESIALTLKNLPVYERCIKVYEGNDLKVDYAGRIFINGKQAKSYTFKLDYYWMMGDNRHNSADSRYWGFVPEDHIVGKPIFIWWSHSPDHPGFSGIRWNRLFTFVDNIK
ncbi:signal peptidase I [Segatella copri]|uniref:Signal peptidase I n=1 Tax=Segatella copri DSM 18205 TaxID=537011 RepID=D1PGA3_9BACT|nr:signal peptidase I [Segatella copri]EFB34268.1 signal peptidase I [Segatella copri DSM 18205]MCW4097130.1 signal peptidase I [Segatella copri]MQP18939.1 signal peptidase I [Segatella copri DSM 18205]UEA43373.1 signal peptidase I [Segatella copri DSM 18205]UWP52016.1 signal peptidase I [Segatella copri DSM 18205]